MIGIIAVILSYLIAVPLGILMARKKDKLVDQLGTIYIVFIIAVPSLAYIFLFKAIGGKMGLPTTFDMDSKSKLMYILPIVSLALPQVANLMKWAASIHDRPDELRLRKIRKIRWTDRGRNLYETHFEERSDSDRAGCSGERTVRTDRSHHHRACVRSTWCR